MGSKQPHAHLSSLVVGLGDPSQVYLSIVVDLVITGSSVFLDLLLIQFQTLLVDESKILRNKHV